jgi:hypothetical protein
MQQYTEPPRRQRSLQTNSYVNAIYPNRILNLAIEISTGQCRAERKVYIRGQSSLRLPFEYYILGDRTEEEDLVEKLDELGHVIWRQDGAAVSLAELLHQSSLKPDLEAV